jgi:hypothetical protein
MPTENRRIMTAEPEPDLCETFEIFLDRFREFAVKRHTFQSHISGTELGFLEKNDYLIFKSRIYCQRYLHMEIMPF